MLRLQERWVWDFWVADDGNYFHLFYLNAPRSLGDERLRHRNARIDHAVSADLTTWTPVGVALRPGVSGAIDQTACWTGSVVREDDGEWKMFYTGSVFLYDVPEQTNIETIGLAETSDLDEWHKDTSFAISADPRWYEVLGESSWPEVAWRDPWVLRSPDGESWNMYITARANYGAVDDRGVIGFATSRDLKTWEIHPPLSSAGAGFGHLEVPQVVQVGGSWHLLFSCSGQALATWRRNAGNTGGIWTVPIAGGPVGQFDTAKATLLTDEGLYSGKVVLDRSGEPVLLAFRAFDGGEFVGEIIDPIPMTVTTEGYLTLSTENLR